jgi:hypothetical protein
MGGGLMKIAFDDVHPDAFCLSFLRTCVHAVISSSRRGAVPVVSLCTRRAFLTECGRRERARGEGEADAIVNRIGIDTEELQKRSFAQARARARAWAAGSGGEDERALELRGWMRRCMRCDGGPGEKGDIARCAGWLRLRVESCREMIYIYVMYSCVYGSYSMSFMQYADWTLDV